MAETMFDRQHNCVLKIAQANNDERLYSDV